MGKLQEAIRNLLVRSDPDLILASLSPDLSERGTIRDNYGSYIDIHKPDGTSFRLEKKNGVVVCTPISRE